MLHYISKGTIPFGNEMVDVYVLNDGTHVFELITITKFITGDSNLSLREAFPGICGDIFNERNVPVITFMHPFDRNEGFTKGISTDTFHNVTMLMTAVQNAAIAGEVKLTAEQRKIADALVFFAQTAEEIGEQEAGKRFTLH